MMALIGSGGSRCRRAPQPVGLGCLLLALGSTLVFTPSMLVAADQREDLAFFESRIRPVLIEKCYSCHSSESERIKGGLRVDSRELIRRGGNSGPAVLPGKPEESLLLQAIAHDGELAGMPPKEKLAAAVIADFRRWVEQGAADPREAVSKAKEGTDRANVSAGSQEKARSWWSLQPIANPRVPNLEPGDAAWARNPIDTFVLSRLRSKGLKPSPEADRRTLIRRVSLDLTGLPPTPEEISSFLVDESSMAYDRLVDRLLATPHYGERWARHWIDLVHFAETHGQDQDRVRPNAWPYRDYLIEAFNQDRPYARFIQEQVAGDVLFPKEPWLTVALGMIAAGPWDESSLRDIREDSIDREVGRYLDRDDMVTTVMSTFQGLTVHCARCHDHKFDPIAQDDYYALQAVFAGIGRGDVAYDADPTIARKRAALLATFVALDRNDSSLDERLDSPEFRKTVAQWDARNRGVGITWDVPEFGRIASEHGSILVKQADKSVRSEGPRPERDT